MLVGLYLALFTSVASAGSLTDIKHVVLFMQENRAFDHYFGTMPGVRGFADPNVQINPDGRSTFQQPVTWWDTDLAEQLTPWYINYLGGEWFDATQCYGAGDNSWEAMHKALNGGLLNQWVSADTPYSMGFFKRRDIPVHFDIAEGWTVGDMYQEGILAATDPNRVQWMSGTVNNPGTPNNPDGDGDFILDNNASPGCERPHFNCYPFNWETIPEYWTDAGVSWQVYQDVDNFEDNMLAYFTQYQKADKNSPLTKFGNTYLGLEKFYEDAANGTLPLISYIVGPAELSEHYPYLPSDGAWLQKKVVDAVTSSPLYKETALIISYDEVGGYADHVTPYTAPMNTPGEWIYDPYGVVGNTPIGPGFRLPFYIISPWTRGSHVFTEHSDHNSQIMFVEEWLTALGYENAKSDEMPPWRREHMSNLIKAFDFDHPDYSIPDIAEAIPPMIDDSIPVTPDGPLGSLDGNYVGAAYCQSQHSTAQPPVPYGPENADQDVSLLVEEGFKQVRGALTEGRYLTFEMNGFALTNADPSAMRVSAIPASNLHDDITQRWVIHRVGDEDGDRFTISSATDGRYVSYLQGLTSVKWLAETYRINDLGNGKGYNLRPSGVLSLGVNGRGDVFQTVTKGGFQVYSVTYHS